MKARREEWRDDKSLVESLVCQKGNMGRYTSVQIFADEHAPLKADSAVNDGGSPALRSCSPKSSSFFSNYHPGIVCIASTRDGDTKATTDSSGSEDKKRERLVVEKVTNVSKHSF